METLIAPAAVGVILGVLVWVLGFKLVSTDRHWSGDYASVLTSAWNWALRSFLGIATLAATVIGIVITVSGHAPWDVFFAVFVPYYALVVTYFLVRYGHKTSARR